MELVVKFNSLDELLEEIKNYFKEVKDWGEEPELFNKRENLRSDMLNFGDSIASYDGKSLCGIGVEIEDYYLDEFISKFEAELWGSIEKIRKEL